MGLAIDKPKATVLGQLKVRLPKKQSALARTLFLASLVQALSLSIRRLTLVKIDSAVLLDFLLTKLRHLTCRHSSLKAKMYSVSSYPEEMGLRVALSLEAMILIPMLSQARLKMTFHGSILSKRVVGLFQ
jgi:hypothetical protein